MTNESSEQFAYNGAAKSFVIPTSPFTWHFRCLYIALNFFACIIHSRINYSICLSSYISDINIYI